MTRGFKPRAGTAQKEQEETDHDQLFRWSCNKVKVLIINYDAWVQTTWRKPPQKEQEEMNHEQCFRTSCSIVKVLIQCVGLTRVVNLTQEQ